MTAVPIEIGIRRPDDDTERIMPVSIDVPPLDDDVIETIDDLDTLVETVMCSCSAGDDNPY